MEASKQEASGQGMASGSQSSFVDQFIGNSGGSNPRDLLSMNGVSSANVTKLNGSNYMPWRRQLGLVMRLSGLDVALTHPCPPQRIEDLAMLLITQTVDDAHKLQIQAEETAKEALASLDRQYANRSIATKHKLLSEFFQFRKSSSDNINQHLGKLKELRAALNNLNERFSEDFFQVVMINSLPSEYGDLMSQWEMIHPSMKNTEFLMQLVQNKEKTIGGPEAILLANGKFTQKPLSLEEKKKKFPCKCCGEFGHWAKECKCSKCRPVAGRTEQRVNFVSSNESQLIQLDEPCAGASPAHVIFSLGRLGAELKTSWILDSGATQHMCNSRDWFSSLTEYEKPIMATIGNGDQIEIWGQGTIDVSNNVGGVELRGTLTEVSYIPSLAANLMSVSAASKNGIKAVFNGQACSLIKKDVQVATGRLVDGSLYVMNIRAIPPNPKQALVVRTSRHSREWHEILGHPSENRMAKLFGDPELGIKTIGKVGECGVCPASKATHVQHPSRGGAQTSEVGERVHVDLGVLRNKDFPSYDYYMLCKDDFSHYCLIYFLDSKAKVNQCLAKLFTDFEYGCGKPIRCLRSDNGSEFVNRQNELLFAKERIVHETSAPYIAQQNGSIEREMRTINTMATALLCQAEFTQRDTYLKIEALRTACFLKNRVPTTMSERTPFEVFTGRKPQLAHLERFGTPVQVLDNVHTHQKLEPKTVNGYIVGFTSRRNTFRVFVPSYKRIIESCDVYIAPHLSKVVQDDRPQEEEVNVRLTGMTKDRPDSGDEEKSEVERVRPPTGWSDDGDRSDVANDLFETARLGEVQSSTMLPRSGRGNGKPYLTGEELDNFFEGYRIEDAQTQADESVEGADGTTIQEDSPQEDWPPTPPPRLSSTLLVNTSTDEPKTYEEATTGPNKSLWNRAIEEELQALKDNGTWEVVERPLNGTTMTTKWVFALKRDISGRIERYKARLVARGFEQKHGIDYFEIYAPVAHTKSIRTILALAGVRQLEIFQFDVSSAFLHGNVEETIFIEPPKGVVIGGGKCLRLIKALYGLRQAPRAWNLKLDRTLREINFAPTVSDPCVYTNADKSIFIVIFVDDGLVVGKDAEGCLSVISKLEKCFKIKRLSGELFVGVEISRAADSLLLSQRRYTTDIIRRFKMADATGATSPTIDVKTLEGAPNSPATKAPYREAIGSLLYLANWTRPDILFVVNLLARYNQAPTEIHWAAVKHIFRYLKVTSHYCLEYRINVDELIAFSDADWGSKLMGRHSMSGVMVTLGGSPIAFTAKKQSTIALSSTEAEYYAACEAGRELAWLTSLFTEIGFKHKTPILKIDNHSTIKQIKNKGTTNASKHIDIKYHYVRQQLDKGLFKLEAVSTNSQAADILTKPLGGTKLKTLLEDTKIMATKPKAENKLGLMAKLAILSITCVALAQLGESITFEKVDPMVWKVSEYRVLVGTQYINLNYLPQSPCNINEKNWVSDLNVKKTAYDGLTTQCEEAYQNTTVQAIEAFARCFRKDENEHKREKRWFEPITLMVIIGITIVAAVGAIGAAAYSYWNEDSSYNRLNKMEERERKRDHEIKALQTDLQEAKGVRAKQIDHAEILGKDTSTNRNAIRHLAQVVPHVALAAYDMKHSITHETNLWKRMTRACGEQRAIPDDYAEMFRLESIRQVKAADTYIDDVSRSKDGLVTIDLYVNKESVDTRIIQVIALPHWVNVTTEPRLMVYRGPMWVAHNKTSDCIIGVDDPNYQQVYQNCTTKGYRDPKLKEWHVEPEDSENFSLLARPKVVKTTMESVIYCLYNNITIMNQTVDCPHYVFKLAINIPFRLNNQEHEFTTEFVRVTERNIGYKTPHLEMYGTDPEYSKAINTIRNYNNKTMTRGNFSFEEGRFRMDMEFNVILTGLSALGAIITIIGFISKCWCNRREQPQGEHINVINSAPPVPLMYSQVSRQTQQQPHMVECQIGNETDQPQAYYGQTFSKPESAGLYVKGFEEVYDRPSA